MKLSDAARQLGLSPKTLRQQIKNRKLRAYKMGADWYVADEEVARYSVENQRKP